MQNLTAWSSRLTVTAEGKGLVGHAGVATVRLLADRSGLTTALSAALTRPGFTPGHDRGRVLTDAAVMMADGGNTMRGIDVLRHQHDLFGAVASPSTLSRALAKIDQTTLDDIDTARATTRAWVWEQIVARYGRIPPARIPGGDLGERIVLRIDAHFIDAHSRKERAGKLNGRFGLHPMTVICDNTGECLAEQLRPGPAGANNADDHIALLHRAITQIPTPWRKHLLITADGAGATHNLLNWLTTLNREPDSQDPDGHQPRMQVEYSVGWPVDKHTGRAITQLPPQAWTPMLTTNGTPGTPATLDTESGPNTVGEVAEITHLLPNLRHWPPGLRVLVRRVKPLRDTTPKPLPGTEQLELDLHTHTTGWRYEAFATNTPPPTHPDHPDGHPDHHPDIAHLDARHRVHARVEDHFRVSNDTGADRLPSQTFTTNAAWHRTHAIATDLIAWLRLLACDNTLTRTEPATLQHRIFHTPATLTHHSRKRRLNFPNNWPYTTHIQAIFTRLFALPTPT
jgi:hypothetical protein